MIASVGRAGRVLDLFTPELPEWRVSEVAVSLGIAKSSAHELVTTLVEIGMLQRTSTGRYRLGWRIVALNRALADGDELRERANRQMTRLASRYGRTMHLAALDGGRVVYLEKVEGTRAMRIDVSGVGLHQPAHCTAVGKVLLAYADDDRVRDAVERNGLQRRTARTITRLADLERELGNVRVLGYANDEQEGVRDLCCVAAPVRDARDRVLAALSISVPAVSFGRYRDGYRDIVVASAAMLSGRS